VPFLSGLKQSEDGKGVGDLQFHITLKLAVVALFFGGMHYTFNRTDNLKFWATRSLLKHIEDF